MTESTRHLNTALIHHDYQPPAGFAGTTVAVQKGSTILFPNMQAVRQRDWAFKTSYTYGLHGTPTSFVLEERLATLEGARHCLLAPSGLAAVTLVNLALLKPGDEVLLPVNLYGPNLEFIVHCMGDFGVTHAFYDPLDPADLAARIGERTALMWLEAAGSITMEFPDLAGLLAVCQARGVRTALDNTWGAGLAFAPFDVKDAGGQTLPLDVSVHALTKYPSGGGDVLMGSICTRDDEMLKTLKRRHMQLGLGVGMNDVESVLRGLPSMRVRYQAQDRAARQLAQFLSGHPAVAQVLHPALPDSPGHAFWQQICGQAENDWGGQGAAAGIFSFVPKGWSPEAIDAFCESLQLFGIGYSWGGPQSLVMCYDMGQRARQPGAHHLQGLRIVRLCIGLEHPDDLQADLAQALEKVG